MFYNKTEAVNSLPPEVKEIKRDSLNKELVSLGENKKNIEDEIKVLSKIKQDFNITQEELDDLKNKKDLLLCDVKALDELNSKIFDKKNSLELLDSDLANKKIILLEITKEISDKNKELINKNANYHEDLQSFNLQISKLKDEILPSLMSEEKYLLDNKKILENNLSDLNNSISSSSIVIGKLEDDISKKTNEYNELLVEINQSKINYENEIIQSKINADKIISDAKTSAQEIINKANSYLEEKNKELVDREGEMSLKEKWLKDKTDNLKMIKEEVEALHGKQIKSLII